MSKLWEVDPETRSKLQEIAKSNENSKCIDCGAPSPQWASPKLGIFFCLACSGIHRSLGVHISFVRSVTMDAFKLAEVQRMSLGGNKPYKDFFNAHASNKLTGTEFDSCTISERYDSEAGEEWKERLTAKVEGTEYVPGEKKKERPAKKKAEVGEIPTPSAGSGRNTPLSRVTSPPQRTASPSQKSRNEAYFASKGAENASRRDDVAPNQGGKYSGFGSEPLPTSSSSSSGGVPSADDFQKDPVAALTKGFGWLSSTVTKQAASVNRSYIQPGMANLAQTDFAAQARQLGTNLGTGVQHGAQGLGTQFSRFVDPGDHGPSQSGSRAAPEKKDFWDSFGADPAGPPKEKKDFWDDFSAAGEQRAQGQAAQAQAQAKPKSVGTSAIKAPATAGQGKKKDEDGGWGDW